MASNGKTKNPLYVTAPGRLLFPHLVEPDTKFVPTGVFDTKIVLGPGEKRDAIIKAIDEAREAIYAEKVKEHRDNKKIVVKRAEDIPYQPETDDEGNPTGNIVLHAKMKHVVEPKDGEPWTQTPDLYDRSAERYKAPITIRPWTGTIARIAFEIVPYFTVKLGAGVTLRLKSAQILALVEGSEKTAEYYGYEPEPEDPQEGGGSAEDDEIPFW